MEIEGLGWMGWRAYHGMPFLVGLLGRIYDKPWKIIFFTNISTKILHYKGREGRLNKNLIKVLLMMVLFLKVFPN